MAFITIYVKDKVNNASLKNSLEDVRQNWKILGNNAKKMANKSKK